MRTLIVFLAFIATVANAADYSEDRELSLDANGIDKVDIEAGAGSLEVVGEENRTEIRVLAHIIVPDADAEEASRKIENNMVLRLDKDGDVAVVKSYFERGMFNFGDSPNIRLVVHVPTRVGLVVDDGSGSLTVEDVRGDIEIDDGSGSISLRNVGGTVEIDDGSGSIKVSAVGGDFKVNDGSGSITVDGVGGSVIVDDGSGSIDVANVEHDFIIIDDGSGGIDYRNVAGNVENNDT